MARTVDEVGAAELGTGGGLHALEAAGALVEAPIAFAGDEGSGDIEDAPEERSRSAL